MYRVLPKISKINKMKENSKISTQTDMDKCSSDVQEYSRTEKQEPDSIRLFQQHFGVQKNKNENEKN